MMYNDTSHILMSVNKLSNLKQLLELNVKFRGVTLGKAEYLPGLVSLIQLEGKAAFQSQYFLLFQFHILRIHNQMNT